MYAIRCVKLSSFFEQGFGSKPKKTGHIKPDLIDVDLVRGELLSSLASEFIVIYNAIGCQMIPVL